MSLIGRCFTVPLIPWHRSSPSWREPQFPPQFSLWSLAGWPGTQHRPGDWRPRRRRRQSAFPRHWRSGRRQTAGWSSWATRSSQPRLGFCTGSGESYFDWSWNDPRVRKWILWLSWAARRTFFLCLTRSTHSACCFFIKSSAVLKTNLKVEHFGHDDVW